MKGAQMASKFDAGDEPVKARPAAPLHEGLMNVDDAAEYLRCKKSWIYDNKHKLRIPHLKVGNQLRFRADDLDRWLLKFTNGQAS